MITVECYSGYRVNERPTAFSLVEGDYTRSFKVREVLDRWFGETGDYFKVEADDGNIYVLKYDSRKDLWDLVFFQNPHRVGELSSRDQSEDSWEIHGRQRLPRSSPRH